MALPLRPIQYHDDGVVVATTGADNDEELRVEVPAQYTTDVLRSLKIGMGILMVSRHYMDELLDALATRPSRMVVGLCWRPEVSDPWYARATFLDRASPTPAAAPATRLPSHVKLRCGACDFLRIEDMFWFAHTITVEASSHMQNICPVRRAGVKFDIRFMYRRELDYDAITAGFTVHKWETTPATKFVHIVMVSREAVGP